MKFFTVIGYNLFLMLFPAVAEVVDKRPPEFVFYFFCFLLVLPELLLIISSGFRKWIKIGVEDADNLFQKDDLKDLISHYVSLWFARMFVLLSLSSIFYGIEVQTYVLLLSAFGSFGIEGAVLLKQFIRVKQ